MRDDGKRDGAPPLPQDVQVRIGDKLKALYQEVVQQPVPDRFKELLAQLDKGQAASSASSGEASKVGME